MRVVQSRFVFLCLTWSVVLATAPSHAQTSSTQSCALASAEHSEGSSAIMMQVSSSSEKAVQNGKSAHGEAANSNKQDGPTFENFLSIGEAFMVGSVLQTAALEEPGSAGTAVLLGVVGLGLLLTVGLLACFGLPEEEEQEKKADPRQLSGQTPSMRPELPKAKVLPPLGNSQASPRSPSRPPLLPIKLDARPSIEASLPPARNIGEESPASGRRSPLAASRVNQMYSRTYPAARKMEEDPATPPQPASPSPPTAKLNLRSRTLCPGLVVPVGSECVLAVRAIPRASGRQVMSKEEAVDILDLTGTPVLKAKVNRGVEASPSSAGGDARPSSWSAGAVSAAREKGQQPSVVLTTLQAAPGPSLLEAVAPGRTGHSDSSALALCYMTSKDGCLGMDICRPNGGLYGRLWRDPSRPRYIVKGGEANEVQLMFDGIFEDHAVLVTDFMQEPVADAKPAAMTFDPAGKYYRLHVSSDIDVGLVLCCLLSIDVL